MKLFTFNPILRVYKIRPSNLIFGDQNILHLKKDEA